MPGLYPYCSPLYYKNIHETVAWSVWFTIGSLISNRICCDFSYNLFGHCVNVCFYFFFQVKQIEKRDSVLTSKQQIDRLLRPGSTYFNLNPFEVSSLSCAFMMYVKSAHYYICIVWLFAFFSLKILSLKFNKVAKKFEKNLCFALRNTMFVIRFWNRNKGFCNTLIFLTCSVLNI